VPLNRALIGREYPARRTYEVSRELIEIFAEAIRDDNPAYHDPEAARALGYRDIVAPPTFLQVIGRRFGSTAYDDPELGLDKRFVVHGEQRYVHHRPVHPGDVLTGVTVLADIRDAGRNELFTIRQEVRTVEGEPVATIYNTLISRGTAAG